MANILEQLDAKLAEILSGWNLLSTLITLSLFAFVAYALYSGEDSDTHPMLLLRQSSAGMVRQPGESAVYRSSDVPHGYPLRTGLQVKAPGAPAYSAGRDGDLRDIWRRVVGVLPLDKQPGAAPNEGGRQKGKILTVFGKEKVEDHDVDEVTREINVIGGYIEKSSGRRVAVYLPNSIELLSSIFAGALYGFTPILLPYNQPHDTVVDLLRRTKADCLIAQAGSLPLERIARESTGVKHVIWVVEKTSRHVDWVQETNQVQATTWHELVESQRSTSSTELPREQPGREPTSVVMIWQSKPGAVGEIVEFTQNNIVAAVAGLISALPARQRMTPADMFLPADLLTNSYTLTLTLAALFSHATVALNSVAGPGIDLALATRNIAPTIVATSAETAVTLHRTTSASMSGILKKLSYASQLRDLAAGRMPTTGLLARLNPPSRLMLGTTPGKLRLLFVAERAGANTPPLSAADLTDLRCFTGARVVYALTAPKVAGAVAQTNVYDYRWEGPRGQHSHFGAPVSSVEVKLVDTETERTTDEGGPRGEIVVSGPAVAGGTTSLGVAGTFREDHTLAYV